MKANPGNESVCADQKDEMEQCGKVAFRRVNADPDYEW